MDAPSALTRLQIAPVAAAEDVAATAEDVVEVTEEAVV